MINREDIEAFLERSGHPHRVVADDTWLVSDPSQPAENIVVRLTEELAIFRMKLLELEIVEPNRKEEFFEQLLRLNGADLVHGSYSIVDAEILLLAAHRLESMDFSAFSGTLDDFSLAVSNHIPQLREFTRKSS